MRYFLTLSYHGGGFCGWQSQPQPHIRTVQGTLSHHISTMLRQEVELVGVGRTDTGVHALEMVAHVDIEKDIDISSFLYRINQFLPPDIVIHTIRPVCADAHARYDATSRTYIYRASTSKNVFSTDQSWYMSHRHIDWEKMNECASYLITCTDFSTFAKKHSNPHTHLCTLTQAHWQQIADNEYKFTITSNRFLRNMVRAIVGTLTKVGTSRVGVDEFRTIVQSKDPQRMPMSAPATGLFLSKVEYPKDIFIDSG